MWRLLARPITNKFASRLPIAEMIDKYAINEESFNSVFKSFTHGRPINLKEIKSEVRRKFEVTKDELKTKVLNLPIETK